jgi:predicted DNA-binding transcriptional regulator AlpA
MATTSQFSQGSDGNFEVPVSAPLLINVDDLADILGISVRSVWRLHSANELPKPVNLRSSIRWRLADIQKWVDAGCPPQDNGRSRPSRK